MQKTIHTLIRRLGVAAGIALVSVLATPGFATLPVFSGLQPQVLAQGPQQPLPPQRPVCNNNVNNNNCCPRGDCIIERYIQPAINLLAASIGLLAVISYIMAGIRYATSADSPQKVSEAKQRIVNTTFMLVGFFIFYAVMNYLIPGGLGP